LVASAADAGRFEIVFDLCSNEIWCYLAGELTEYAAKGRGGEQLEIA
jgi:hypothetical protein